MAEPLTLTIALERYDRHFPFFDGTVTLPPGLDLKVLQVGQEANEVICSHFPSCLIPMVPKVAILKPQTAPKCQNQKI